MPDQLNHGIKIAAQLSPEPSTEDITFIRQLGVDYVVLNVDGEKASQEYYLSRRKLFEEAGITVYGINNKAVHNSDAIILNLPNRDEKLEEYKNHLANLGRASIPYTTWGPAANGIWSTEPERSRGGAISRAFDLQKARQGQWNGKTFKMPLSHGRKYSEEEIWENYKYYIKEIASVAEESGVLIGIHPVDPPVSELAGIPRCIFGSFDGYEKAFEIADSPNIGMCLCVGCWLEGGESMGRDVIETIRYFGKLGKIFKVHFRNVNAPLPHFVETLLDNGYMNMRKVAEALEEVDFKGVVIADHVPLLTGDSKDNQRVSTAFSLGYMKALFRRAGDAGSGE